MNKNSFKKFSKKLRSKFKEDKFTKNLKNVATISFSLAALVSASIFGFNYFSENQESKQAFARQPDQIIGIVNVPSDQTSYIPVYFTYGSSSSDIDILNAASNLSFNTTALQMNPNTVADLYDTWGGFPTDRITSGAGATNPPGTVTCDSSYSGNSFPISSSLGSSSTFTYGLQTSRDANNPGGSLSGTLTEKHTGCIFVEVRPQFCTTTRGSYELTFDPDANLSSSYQEANRPGRQKLAIQISDPTNPANCQVQQNQPPVANNDAASTNQGVQTTIDVLENDTDSDGSIDTSSVTLSSATTAQGGSVSVNGSGIVTYNPPSGYTGTDSFTYTVDDNQGETSNQATVTITVNSSNQNQPPVANNDSASTNQGVQTTIDVLENDTDSDGSIDTSSVTLSSATTAQGGSVSVNGSGIVTYNPASGFSGNDSFTYTVRDNDGSVSNLATVNITVTSVAQNIPPVASNDSRSTDENQEIVINVISNDSDSDGSIDPSSIEIASNPSKGTVSVDSSTGQITYTPNSGESGSDSFTYTVRDNEGDISNIATVNITINTAAQPGFPSLTISKSADPSTVTTNTTSNIEFTIEYSNNGDTESNETIITDTLPNELEFVSCSNSCIQDGQNISWELGTLNSNSAGSVLISAKLAGGIQSGNYDNVAAITGSNANSANSTATITVQAAIIEGSVSNPNEEEVIKDTEIPRTGGTFIATIMTLSFALITGGVAFVIVKGKKMKY